MIGETRQRVGDRQLTPRALHITLRRDDRGENETRHGGDARPDLEEGQRFARGIMAERTVAVDCANDCRERDDENRGGRFPRSETERCPDQHRPEEDGQRVIARRIQPAENRKRDQRGDQRGGNRLDELAAVQRP